MDFVLHKWNEWKSEMILGTYLYTWFFGKFVGSDIFGNMYYEEKKSRGTGFRKRRWVLYKGEREASKIPVGWHGWMHYTYDSPILTVKDNLSKMSMNFTGTTIAYYPEIMRKGQKQDIVQDYNEWDPSQKT